MNTTTKLVVIYYRVSTKKQGQSGLGLDAQQTIVTRFLNEHSTIVATFTEIETGKSATRPQLRAALALCAQNGATLIVAKLDRLARNVAFTSALMNSGIEFIACDCPYATRLTIHILAAVAEDEALRIASRTKGALQELKAQGVKLGSARPGHWEGREHLRGWQGIPQERAIAIKKGRLEETYANVLPLIRVLQERNETFASIANALNQQGFKTPRGKAFTPSTVHSVATRMVNCG
jgi:DNA invertase Pin-like site-specific DNA recombinase